MIRRHHFLLLLLLLAAHWTGCTRRAYAPDEHPSPRAAVPVASLPHKADSLPANKAGLPTLPVPARRFFGLLPPKRAEPLTYTPTIPRKCKGCQITIQNGNGNQATQASIGKNKAAAIQASDSATQQVATNAVAGNGNKVEQTATTKEAPGLLATLGKPIGYVLAVALAGAGLYLLYLIWAFLPKRKTDSNA